MIITRDICRYLKENAYDGQSVIYFKSGCNENKAILDSRITIEDNKIYVCQDKENGADCLDKKGYKYSWLIYNEMDCEAIELAFNEKEVPNFPTEIFNNTQKGIRMDVSDDGTNWKKDFIYTWVERDKYPFKGFEGKYKYVRREDGS